MHDLRYAYPMFVMVLLSFSTLVRLFLARTAAVREGTIDARYFRFYQGATEPEHAQQLTRHFSNLFEAPVLYYAACFVAILLPADNLTFGVACGYVAARVLHTFVHTGGNRLMQRVYVYFTSWALLLVLWCLLVVRVATVA